MHLSVTNALDAARDSPQLQFRPLQFQSVLLTSAKSKNKTSIQEGRKVEISLGFMGGTMLRSFILLMKDIAWYFPSVVTHLASCSL